MNLFSLPAEMRPLLLTTVMAFCLTACESIQTSSDGPSEAGNQIDAGSPSVSATAPSKPTTLEGLLRNTQLAQPADLFEAALLAIKLNRLTDAGVLYQEAQIRRMTDLRRFPPTAEAQAELKRLDQLKGDVSKTLGPKLLDKPRLYALVAQRLEARSCATGLGYEPAWPHHRTVSGVDCTRMHQQKVKQMRDLSVLLSLPDYAEAAQLAEYYRSSSSSVRELAGLKEGYLRAIATMRSIERSQKRMGLSTRL